jgi:hypothetical protein
LLQRSEGLVLVFHDVGQTPDFAPAFGEVRTFVNARSSTENVEDDPKRTKPRPLIRPKFRTAADCCRIPDVLSFG